MLDRVSSDVQTVAWILLLWTNLWSSFTQAIQPVGISWSDSSYGPDGPWQAVEVSIGSDSQSIALYPGGTWASTILLQSSCSNSSISSICYADAAGLFDPATSTTWDNTSIDIKPDGESWATDKIGASEAVPINALAKTATDTINLSGMDVPLADLIAIKEAYQTYPGGQIYPLQVGVLALSAPRINQTFTEGTGIPSYNATIATSWAYTSGQTSSYSYGMHIGSAALGIPGSLYFGGYDGNRVFGDVSSQPYNGAGFPIQLQDLSIGVETGGSPWNYSIRTGLLAEGNSSITGTIQTDASPEDPYIYLPQSSCDALAAQLPVTYQSDLGLYFWNTSDPQYAKVVTSPSYIGFTFDLNGNNNQNFTIKVPFALLNLTLKAPLTTAPTSYFPCMGTDNSYALGRAFFQAAFLGFNWNNEVGDWFLAQAPGPGLITSNSLVVIEPDTTALNGSTSDWAETWSAHWTVLPSNTTATNETSPASTGTTSDGLSTGAKAGIGVGAAVGALLLISVGIWAFVIRRRRRNPNGTNLPVTTTVQDTTQYKGYYGQGNTLPSVASSAPQPPSELASSLGPTAVHELPAVHSTIVHET